MFDTRYQEFLEDLQLTKMAHHQDGLRNVERCRGQGVEPDQSFIPVPPPKRNIPHGTALQKYLEWQSPKDPSPFTYLEHEQLLKAVWLEVLHGWLLFIREHKKAFINLINKDGEKTQYIQKHGLTPTDLTAIAGFDSDAELVRFALLAGIGLDPLAEI